VYLSGASAVTLPVRRD